MAGTVRLLAVGDLQLGDSATCVGFGFRSRVSPQRVVGALSEFRSAVGPADIQFANLETPLSDFDFHANRRRSRQLRGTPDLAHPLRSAGFTVLNVANNHSLEHGTDAFLDSVEHVEAQGISVCGQRGSEGWSSRPVVLNVNDLRIGVLGYSLRPSGDRADRPHAESTEAEILEDVARLSGEVDDVIVSLHWGEEFVLVPCEDEVAFAHRIVDAGATLILGHHPHVARPVERYGDSIIAYSLGNFAADMVWHDPLRHGLVLDCEFGAGRVDDVRVYRTRIDDAFLPRVDVASTLDPSASSDLGSLPRDEYVRQARETVRAQRRDLYRYTLRNAWRFDPSVLVDLATSTVRGKFAGLFGTRDEIWG